MQKKIGAVLWSTVPDTGSKTVHGQENRRKWAAIHKQRKKFMVLTMDVVSQSQCVVENQPDLDPEGGLENEFVKWETQSREAAHTQIQSVSQWELWLCRSVVLDPGPVVQCLAQRAPGTQISAGCQTRATEWPLWRQQPKYNGCFLPTCLSQSVCSQTHPHAANRLVHFTDSVCRTNTKQTQQERKQLFITTSSPVQAYLLLLGPQLLLFSLLLNKLWLKLHCQPSKPQRCDLPPPPPPSPCHFSRIRYTKHHQRILNESCTVCT